MSFSFPPPTIKNRSRAKKQRRWRAQRVGLQSLSNLPSKKSSLFAPAHVNGRRTLHASTTCPFEVRWLSLRWSTMSMCHDDLEIEEPMSSSHLRDSFERSYSHSFIILANALTSTHHSYSIEDSSHHLYCPYIALKPFSCVWQISCDDRVSLDEALNVRVERENEGFFSGERSQMFDDLHWPYLWLNAHRFWWDE